jgi:hypothetical protein
MIRGIRCPLRKPGSRFKSASGDWVTVGKDFDIKRVHVVFDSGTVGVLQYQHIKHGDFKDWMQPSLCGVGYAGSYMVRGSAVSKRIYRRWAALIQRCYDPVTTKAFATYEGVSVCEDWHNYTKFKEWLMSKKNFDSAGWHIDKDLLCGGKGKLYSPDACILLPAEVNTSLQTVSHKDATCRSLGVFFEQKSQRYVAVVRADSKCNVLGKFRTEIEAARVYKAEKEKAIRDLAEKWKDKIEVKTYEALLKWEVPVINFEESNIVQKP